jgi:hypothetical protein
MFILLFIFEKKQPQSLKPRPCQKAAGIWLVVAHIVCVVDGG